MASFSNLSKTYAKDKLSKCATMVLLVYCYVYRKRSKVNNVNAEAKEHGREICKLPSTTPVFLPRYREARKLPLVLVGAPRQESIARAKHLVG